MKKPVAKMDVSAVIIFHEEGLLASSSIYSFRACCQAAVDRGLSVERIAIADRAGATTRRVLEAHRNDFSSIVPVEFGDLGPSRNQGRASASGRFLTYFDGDDLWGDEWIWRAFERANTAGDAAIFHPEFAYYFSAEDYIQQSVDMTPPANAKSFFIAHDDSDSPTFDPRTLLLNNVWTANSLAARTIYERFPYRAKDRSTGFGVEDWTWNVETLANGLTHKVVPETVHCIRQKTTGSLGSQNVSERVLPSTNLFADKLLGM